MQTPPENKFFIFSSPRDQAVKLAAITFTILAALLVGVGYISLMGASEIEKNYSLHLSKTVDKLELVNRLHLNNDEVNELIISITSPKPSDKTELVNELRAAHDENSRLIRKLEKITSQEENKKILQQLIAHRQAYYHHSDSIAKLALVGRINGAALYKAMYLTPVEHMHQHYLSMLSDNFRKATDKRETQAARLLSGFVEYQEVLIALVLLATACAAFLMQYLFRRLRRENIDLSNEIKKRQELQNELYKSQHIYKTLFNSNPIPMWIYDLNTLNILKVNKAAAKEYGYTREEFLKKKIHEVKLNSDLDRYLDEIIPNAKQHSVFYNVKHRRKDGSEFRVEVHSHALPAEEGVCPRLVVAVNVDDQYRAIEQIERNEKQLREVSSSIPGAVYQYHMSKDMIFSFPFVSTGIEKLYGVSPEDIYKRPSLLYKNVHPEDLERMQRTTLDSFWTLKPWILEFRVWQAEEKRYLWVRGHSLPTKRDDGSVQWNGTFIDITSQKEAQEELARNEANLRALLDSSNKAILLLDSELKVLSFNKLASNYVWQMRQKELLAGQSICNFIDRGLLPELKEDHALAMQGKPVNYETGYNDGWYEVSVSPVTSHDNQILAVALNIFDISEQKRAIETIKHNKAQLARAQQLAKLGNWELDLRSGLMYWSDEVYHIYGERMDSFIPTSALVDQRTHPEDREKVAEVHRKAVQARAPLSIGHRILMQDGSIRYIHEICEAEFNTAGEAIRLSGTVQDVTKYKEAEREIREAKNLLQSTLENIPEVIFSVDVNLNINYISPQCQEVTGYSEADFLGNTRFWLSTVHPADRRKLLASIVADVLAGNRTSNELRIIDSQGDERWVMLRLSPKLDREGRVIRIDGSAFDMTAYKQAEDKRTELTEQLMQQNKNLQQFAYIVSHNLRAPIANILGLTSIYDRRRPEAVLNQRVIDNLSTSALLLDTTIRDLNDILTIRSKVEEGKEMIDFKLTLEHILASISDTESPEEIDIAYDFSEVPEIVAIRSYVQSIMQNLVSNALKYKSESRKLRLRLKTFKVSEYICLEVEDNGQGIDLEKERDKIFGLYKRFHHNKEGKGLGLHLVKTQAELLGGKVEVNSKPDMGSIFKVYLKHQV